MKTLGLVLILAGLACELSAYLFFRKPGVTVWQATTCWFWESPKHLSIPGVVCEIVGVIVIVIGLFLTGYLR